MSIPLITPPAVGSAVAGSAAPAAIAPTSTSFADELRRLVEGAEQSANVANDAVTGMMDKSLDVHDAMIALQRAEMSLQLAVQVRNKLVQAYQDIMRMPV